MLPYGIKFGQIFFEKLCVKKENTSFYVFRKGTIVFCVYYKGHVNITGIRTLQQIQNCVDFLSVVPGVKTIQSVQVDNITCSAKLHEHIYTWNQSFRKYLQRLATNKNFLKIRYCPQTFPGAFLKLTKQGTIVFFATGKFNIVGCKSFTDIQDLVYKFLIAIKHLSS